jgi:serine phosphatase RsbU (regulator of sigma subunit)
VETEPVYSDATFARRLRRATYSPVVSLGFLVVGLLGLVFFLLMTFRAVDHTNRVIAEALRAEKLLLDLQAATRGFYLTGDVAFLARYRESQPELPQVMADLRQRVADNPAQAALAATIERGSREWIGWTLDTLGQVTRGAATQSTARQVQEDKARFDHLSGDIARFLRAEYELRDQRANRAVRAVGWSLMLALAASAVVALLQYRGVRGQIAAINEAYRDVLRLARERRLRAQDLLKELDRELQAVGEIQRSLLPIKLPAIPGLEIAASYQTSRRAGGDYYDFFRLPAEHGDGGHARYGILIADVSGHGTPAAVLMAVTHSIAHGFDHLASPPGELLAFVNRRLCDHYTASTGTFVTAFYAIYDPLTRELTYSSAGHNPPRLRGGDADAFEPLDHAVGFPLGVVRDEEYASATRTLRPGDTLVLYTDGITEARNERDEQLGVARLDRALAGDDRHPDALLAAALATVRQFAGELPEDDRTLLVLRVCEPDECNEPGGENARKETIVVETPIDPLAALRA